MQCNFRTTRKAPAVGKAPRAARSVSAKAATVEAPSASAETVNDCINAIRFLSIDAVNKANSGHPGAPMGCAPMSYVLWNEFMKYNPKNPLFWNRDRFVLSVGHASMLQYSLMHLCGFDSVQMEDMKNFRQLESKCPGHPENFVTEGVEVTTGPLGQGIANAVGMALAEANLAARFNRDDAPKVVDHYTYCILGDGCMMEGISNEACSLAGHWGLDKLICFYDDNEISIDGDTDIAFTEDVAKRYEALGWNVLDVADGNTDVDAIRKAVEQAKQSKGKPTLIVTHTLIGYGSPNKVNSYAAHGAPLGKEEADLTRGQLGWSHGEFEVPDAVYKTMRDSCVERGAAVEAEWQKGYEEWKGKYPDEAKEYEQIMTGELPAGWDSCLPTFSPEDKGLATRQHSQTMLNAIGPVLPGFIGGSADLAGSNLTLMKFTGDFQKDSPAERNVRYGVREHGMGAISTGIAAYAPGCIPYCATFLIFTDYMRGAIRVAALSEFRHLFVMTHDSIGLGEDGPTHQPVEHLASFRAMPGIYTWRPCGGNETAGAYKFAVEKKNAPSVFALSRQAMPNYAGCTVEGTVKGGYVVEDCDSPTHIIIGTGSELQLCMEAAKKLKEEGIAVRVVSMPCTELFDEQSDEYKESVLPAAVTKRLAVEALHPMGWSKYTGLGGKVLGVERFGASAPGPDIYKAFGITTDKVIELAKSL